MPSFIWTHYMEVQRIVNMSISLIEISIKKTMQINLDESYN